MAQPVQLGQMLEAREKRAARQRELLLRYQSPLIWFTMNIPGHVKTGAYIRRGFDVGCELLEGQLMREKANILYQERHYEVTGCEACYVVEGDALSLKQLAVEVEENVSFGRLFDIDVLAPSGERVSRGALGLGERRCLICGGPAKACARSRAHSMEELRQKITELLKEALDRREAQKAAEIACRALLYEVATTPKPGLVDCRNSGSHQDMDIFTFISSAMALWPYFEQCVQVGQATAGLPPKDTFAALTDPGKLAEAVMLKATGGVNTHKGAIFTIGTICAALGRLPQEAWRIPETVLREVSAMAEGVVERGFSGLTERSARTAGEKLYLRCGVTGARGQLEAGLPVVREVGLPVLEKGLKQGKTMNEAGCASLLSMLAAQVDTNMAARGGLARQKETAEEIFELLEREPYPALRKLEELDDWFIQENLSPGGSADLLAVCYLLHFLREEAF